MKVMIDSERCTGHGRCYSLSPDVFGPDENGYGEVLIDGEVPAGLEAQARAGVANCPERAIELES